MPNPLATSETWLKTTPMKNVQSTVAVTVFKWNEYSDTQGPPDYTYYGSATMAPPRVIGDIPLYVNATLYGGLPPTDFFSSGVGYDAATNQVIFQDLMLTDPSDYGTGTNSAEPTVASSDGGEMVQLDFPVKFPGPSGQFGSTGTCRLLLQQSARYIVPPVKVQPIKAVAGAG